MQNVKRINKKIKLLLKGEAHPLTLTWTGFGLIEVVVAVSIMIIILGAVAVLQKNAIRNSVIAAERTQAYNLVREGIEAVRAIRDSKWIDQTAEPWNKNFTTASEFDVEMEIEKWILQPAPLEEIPLDKQKFLRKIFFENIADSQVIGQLKAMAGLAYADKTAEWWADYAIKMTVVVSWNSYGKNYQITSYEYLTDWKPPY